MPFFTKTSYSSSYSFVPLGSFARSNTPNISMWVDPLGNFFCLPASLRASWLGCLLCCGLDRHRMLLDRQASGTFAASTSTINASTLTLRRLAAARNFARTLGSRRMATVPDWRRQPRPADTPHCRQLLVGLLRQVAEVDGAVRWLPWLARRRRVRRGCTTARCGCGRLRLRRFRRHGPD